MNWLCWHVGTVTDPKFTVVARLSKQPRQLVLCVWAALLEHARQNDGDVSCVDYDALGVLFDTDGENVGAIYLIMEERGLIAAGKIANWNKRQHANSTERVKRFRERQRVTETDETVSAFHGVTETPETGHTDIQTDIQTKKKEDAPPTAAPRAKACRLPDDWAPAPENFPHELIDRELPRFRDFWRAKSGKDAVKLDWQATWRNWLRRSDDFKTARIQAGGGSTAGIMGAAVSDIDSQWRARLRAYKPRGFWSPNWGNRPEEGNRDIPPHIYAEWRDGQLGSAA